MVKLGFGGGLSAQKVVTVLAFGLVFLWLISQVINISALNSDDPNAQVIRDLTPEQFENLAADGFKWIIVALATILAFRFGLPQGRLDRKAIVSLIIIGVLLFFLYERVLVPLLDGTLPSLSQSAVQLQAITGP